MLTLTERDGLNFIHVAVDSNCFTGGLYFSDRCVLQVYRQDVFGHPILYLQTCLAVPGWPCFAVLTVPKMLFGLGAGLLLYWQYKSASSAQNTSWVFLVLVGSIHP